MQTNTFSWEESFPMIYSHTSISFLKRCSGFTAAKHGDINAAEEIVRLCAKEQRIMEMKKKYPNAILLPIMTENCLPVALAKKIGLKMHCDIQINHNKVRKSMSGMERFLDKPIFSGKIKRGENYIIVDDVVTQGGTVAALRRYILDCGGRVSAIAALALSYSSSNGSIAPLKNNINMLGMKFDYTKISTLLSEAHIANDLRELTNPQIKYLLRFKEISQIIRKIEDCSQTKPA